MPLLRENDYPVCDRCNYRMNPVWFIEHEYGFIKGGGQYRTGRTRRAVDHFVCPMCLKKECVDDSFDGPWR